MEIGTAAAAAWSSGISVYGVAALLGLAGRFDWVDSPDFLQQAWVIVVALALFAVELVADKVPYVDSAWDGVHTVIRPLVGGYLLTTASDSQLSMPALAAAGVGLALSSHSAKASTRLLVNASPEPFSNSVVSVTEDGIVAGLMTLAIAWPRVALVITLVLAVCSTIATVVMFRAARRMARRLARRRRERVRPAPD